MKLLCWTTLITLSGLFYSAKENFRVRFTLCGSGEAAVLKFSLIILLSLFGFELVC
jgi:hypothetical protein